MQKLNGWISINSAKCILNAKNKEMSKNDNIFYFIEISLNVKSERLILRKRIKGLVETILVLKPRRSSPGQIPTFLKETYVTYLEEPEISD